MSHKFESGVFFGEGAWHGLGTVLDADDRRRFSVAGAIQAAGLDWTVEKLPVQISDEAGVPEELRGAGIVGHYHTVRMSDLSLLGMVGESYSVLQNRDVFEWFQPFLDTREVSIETAGSLADGRIVWAMARLLGDDIDVGGGDTVRPYLLLSTSHDGSRATRVGFAPVRVVCWNTLCMAERDEAAKLLRVRHTSGQHDALAAVRDSLDLVRAEFAATAEQYRRLLAMPISRTDLRAYVKIVLQLPENDDALSGRAANQVARIVELAEGGIGQDGRLSAWSAYQGVTEWISHERQPDAQTRVNSMWFGASAKTNRRALDLALQLAS